MGGGMQSCKVSTRLLQILTVSLIRNQGLCQFTCKLTPPSFSETMSHTKDTTTSTDTPTSSLSSSAAVPDSCFPVYSSASNMPSPFTLIKSLSTESAGINDPIQESHDNLITSSAPISKKPRTDNYTPDIPCTAFPVHGEHNQSPRNELSDSETTPAKVDNECLAEINYSPVTQQATQTKVDNSPVHVTTGDGVEDTNGSSVPSSEETSKPDLETNKEESGSELIQELPFCAESDTSNLFETEECDSSEVDGGTDSRSTQKRGKRNKPKKEDKQPRPNAFVSVRIPSAEIRQKMEEVQQKMLERDKNLKWAFVSLVKSHLTLLVIRLDTNDENLMDRANEALIKATEEVESSLMLKKDPLVLKFSGIGSFSSNVVYAKIEEGPLKERFISMAEIVQDVFSKHGLPTMDSRTFSPHLTIAKVTPKARKKGVKRIPSETYSDLLSMDFGSQKIQGLELLSMSLPATEDGYYHSFHHCNFSE